MTTDADAIIILANSIDLLSAALEHVAEKITPGGPAQTASPSGSAGSPPGPSGPPGGNNVGQKTVQQKRGGLIFMTAKDHNTNATACAESAGLGAVDPDARKWSDGDQQQVLDAMKDWGWLS